MASQRNEIAALVKELQELRRGYGLQSDDLDAREVVGLRERCDGGTETGEEFRERLVRFLSEVIVEFPGSEREMVRHILAMEAGEELGIWTKRMGDLAARLNVDQRTVRRRIDALFKKMAETILSGRWARDGDGFHGAGWYVDLLDVVLRLDVYPMQSIERRTIVATRDGLEEVVNSVDLVPQRTSSVASVRDPRSEVIFGAVSDPEHTISGENLQSRIVLPRRLMMGERHTYSVVITTTPTAPHYVCIPLRRFNRFLLRIRFDRRRVPSLIWVLDGVLHRRIDRREPSDVVLQPDGAGEVKRRFDSLDRGVAYGIQWQPLVGESN